MRGYLRTAGAACIAGILLFPVYWMLLGSFMRLPDLFHVPPYLWPPHPTLQNWANAFQALTPYVKNSLVVALGTAALTVCVAGPAGYALVWLRVRGKNALITLALVSQMLPAIVFVLPLFLLYNRLGLLDTYTGLVLANGTFTIPFGLLMLRAYFHALSYESVEAALVDGANHYVAFLRIVLPVMVPSLVTIGMFAFLYPWGNFVFALGLATGSSIQPLTVQLSKALGVYGTDWGLLLAGSVIMAIPAVAFLVTASRYIVTAVTAGELR